MSDSLHLNEQELNYLQDTAFLTAKLKIQKQMRTLLEKCLQRTRMQQVIFMLPPQVWEVPPKISRGENYEGLPYLVLDYPRIFQQEAVFACRTMLWWGWGFSCTLHLGGTYWQQYQPEVLKNLHRLDTRQWWVCVNDGPWEYHYREDNYILLENCLEENRLDALARKTFFKISRRLPLERYQQLPAFCTDSLQKISAILGQMK